MTRTPRRHLARWATASVLMGLGLAACGDDADSGDSGTGTPTANPPPVTVDPTPSADEDTADPDGSADEATTDPGPTETPTERDAELPTVESVDPSALPPWATPGTPAGSEPAGEALLPVELRTGDHEDFDRVVLEMAGDGEPGWRVEYVEEAVTDGKGERLEIDGDAILQVYVSGTRYPAEGEEHYDGPMTLEGEDSIEEVRYVGTFEGLTQLFVGVDDDQADYRVFALAEPARLVIDIRED